MSLQRLTGKAAVVTGGANGLGRAICQKFAEEGASVAIVDIDVQGMEEVLSLLTRNNNNVHCTIKADVTVAKDVAKCFKIAEEKLGKKVTILVNSAGMFCGLKPIGDVTEKLFDDVVQLNLKGTFLPCKEFINSLENSEVSGSKGSIVNISTIDGIKGNAKIAPYSSSKFGVVGLTKTLAMEYEKHKVRCNVVLPGSIDTPMLDTVGDGIKSILLKIIPMSRFGKPDEVANACLFLASEESSYMNGANLEVTGGLWC
uniref:estradiol 17-beta-dehydrogenase 8-like n=1 Tax=Styela clava TaxID=7725 RepID=UPI00193A472C|nr:estradiol 17-beta-dehydrogenase 8-like [Styela clava]